MEELRANVAESPRVHMMLLMMLVLLMCPCADSTPRLQMVLHLLNIIGPRASVFDPWISQVTVNAMLSALELENDITVLQSLFLTVHPFLQNEPDECLSAVRKRAVHLNESELPHDAGATG